MCLFHIESASLSPLCGIGVSRAIVGVQLSLAVLVATHLAPLCAVAATAEVSQRLKWLSSPPGNQQYFGGPVAIDGNLGVVSETFGYSNGVQSGTVHMFNVHTGARLRNLQASDAAYVDLFGSSVGISGNMVIVGSPNRNTGSAYLFNATTGRQTHKLAVSGLEDRGEWGISVAISENVAVVTGSSKPEAIVFDVATGEQRFRLTPSDVATSAYGRKVSVDGNNVAFTTGGAVYLFDASTGLERFKLSVPGQWLSGSAIEGDLTVAGSDDGTVHVFDVLTGESIRQLIPSELLPREVFPWSIDIEGNLAVVSSRIDVGSRFLDGWAYLFDVTSGEQLAKFSSDAYSSGDWFGGSVGISGNRILVSASATNLALDNDIFNWGHGAAYVFDFVVVPEPSTLLLLATAILGSVSFGRSRNTRQKWHLISE